MARRGRRRRIGIFQKNLRKKKIENKRKLEADAGDMCPSTSTPRRNKSPGLIPISPLTHTITSPLVLCSEIEGLEFTALERNLILNLNRSWCVRQLGEGLIVYQLSDELPHLKVLKSISVSNSGKLTITVHGHVLPPDHSLLKDIFQTDIHSSEDITKTVLNVVSKLSSCYVCCGNFEDTYRYLWDREDSRYYSCGILDKTYCSSISQTFRIHNCELLINSETSVTCGNCSKFRKKLRTQHSRETTATAATKKNKAHSKMTKEQLKDTLRGYSRKMHNLSNRVLSRNKKIESLIQNEGISLATDMHNDLHQTIIDNNSKMTDIQKLFWQQQVKSSTIKNKKGMRWHPLMIRLALRIRMLSNTAYEAIQESGVIQLPSQCTLFDYTHHMEAMEGCQAQVLEDINNSINAMGIPPERRYFSLMFDEMNIKNNLVFRLSSGEFIGYVKLNEVEAEFTKIDNLTEKEEVEPVLAKKVLVYRINGLACKLKDVVAVYSTVDLTASQLYNRTWDVIYHMEVIGVKIICLVCDGAGPNRNFFQMNKSSSDGELVYETINYSGELRPLYFISDPPHLLKTLRNCFSNSYAHKKSRKLWNKSGDISWHLVERLYESTKTHTLRKGFKLTSKHVYLNSFSCMKVNLAAQVLSDTVAMEMEMSPACNNANTNSSATVEFIRICNKFFDCLNGCHTEEGRNKRNENLNPYRSADDDRFNWLQTTFMSYFQGWSQDINSRQGQFSHKERSQMIISRQTMEGLFITINGFIGATKYLLSHGVKYVNARSFNQDLLEQYFGKQRRSCGTNNNPSLNQFLQNTVSLRLQGQLASASKRGNTESMGEGGLKVDDKPLPKRKKKE